jgi:3-oxoacyl-[acyl-carrier protein] reductase
MRQFACCDFFLRLTETPNPYETTLALNPTGRMGTRHEMANPSVFLAGRAASFITGTNLVVDGALQF